MRERALRRESWSLGRSAGARPDHRHDAGAIFALRRKSDSHGDWAAWRAFRL